jgi:diguanylate cyclase (GGDEF)-like protein
MSAELPPDDGQQLRDLFLKELADGQRRAREAHDRLRRADGDAKALGELRMFFHRIAGTAESVGYGLLGRLAAACEGAADLLVETGAPVGKTALQIFADGLLGVTDLLAVETGRTPSVPPPRSVSELSPVITIEGQPSRILVVDDDPFSARLVDNVLRGAGFASSYCCEPGRAFEVILAEQPDLVILDVVMPGVDGFDLCQRIRAHAGLQLTPIIFVTRKGDVEQRVRGLQVGGNDYVAKPFEPQELVARVRSHLQRLSELREMAIRDGLTRCYNNKYFKARTEQELIRARRYGAELTLGMLDIDHFKRVNDTFGHPAGDAVLAHLASLLTASVRSTDVVARFGGEEFGFLLIESAVPESAIITNRLRERIAKHEFHIPSLSGSDLVISCTVSIGLGSFMPGDSPAQLLARADAALLSAKQGGRNQVRVGA